MITPVSITAGSQISGMSAENRSVDVGRFLRGAVHLRNALISKPISRMLRSAADWLRSGRITYRLDPSSFATFTDRSAGTEAEGPPTGGTPHPPGAVGARFAHVIYTPESVDTHIFSFHTRASNKRTHILYLLRWPTPTKIEKWRTCVYI